MAYRWIEHTAEVELAIEAGSEDEVFAEAVAGLAELLGDGAAGAPPRDLPVRVEGTDRAALLAALLEEIVFRAEVEAFVPQSLTVVARRPGEIEAIVHGHDGEPPHLVKAVTYHRLSFEEDSDGRWRATLVLDV